MAESRIEAAFARKLEELGLRERVEVWARQHPDASDEEVGEMVLREFIAYAERQGGEEPAQPTVRVLREGDLFDALDTGFRALAHLAGAEVDTPEELVLHAQSLMDDPHVAECLIVAAVVERTEDATLAWFYDEWKRRKRAQLGQGS